MEYQNSISRCLLLAVNIREATGRRTDALSQLHSLIQTPSPVHIHHLLQSFDGLLVPLEQLLGDTVGIVRQKAAVAMGALGALKPEPIIHYLFNKLQMHLHHDDGLALQLESSKLLLCTVCIRTC
jgi:hypothetical protein